ncbi:hypothetical protein [Sphingomonas sp. CROZ-RG-20F-R02-07]|uniref:hypothetical protein n=1 Tax=Sphingomonas sp. CROZ-RG-20F-R02-07 TaxID=2914832 RepID=UPI001F593BE5|nr:hypothetical protein [Sphingomonas sp. CROZ-RG-20F-R02-07]
MIRTGIAWLVSGASVPDTNQPATKVQVLTGATETSKVAFFVPEDGPQIAEGDSLSWGTNHVDVRRPDGSTFTLHKLGYDFDPDAPIH